MAESTRHGAPKTLAVPTTGDDLISASMRAVWPARADCCVAVASFRVVLPPSASRPTRRELTLCAHHFRDHAPALDRAGAIAYDTSGALVGLGM